MGSRRDARLALTLVAAALGGCASYGSHLTASTLEPGTRELSLNADALVVVEEGRIVSVEAFDGARVPAGVPVDHYPNALLCPGFVDTHVHFPQLEVIGSFGTQLLEWLDRYTFPAEMKFADGAYARRVARLFQHPYAKSKLR